MTTYQRSGYFLHQQRVDLVTLKVPGVNKAVKKKAINSIGGGNQMRLRFAKLMAYFLPLTQNTCFV